jgi:hypothetical protein
LVASLKVFGLAELAERLSTMSAEPAMVAAKDVPAVAIASPLDARGRGRTIFEILLRAGARPCKVFTVKSSEFAPLRRGIFLLSRVVIADYRGPRRSRRPSKIRTPVQQT